MRRRISHEISAVNSRRHGDIYVGEVPWTTWPADLRSLQKFEKVEVVSTR
jgi:hypothetical protein